MQDQTGKQKTLALLIDADNISAQAIKEILDKVSSLGNVCVKRMYGDWTTPNLSSWKKVMQEYALQPVQQFAYTTKKNSTDGAMMIDAMDLMYTNRFDGFCICSSDSDFTRLAIRLREQGLSVHGFGRSRTPVSFVSACSEFSYIDSASQESDPKPSVKPKATAPAAHAATKAPTPAQDMPAEQSSGAKRIIHDAIESCKDKTGWASGALLGKAVDPKHFGCKKLMTLVGKFPENFEVQFRLNDSGNRLMFLRNKPGQNTRPQTGSSLH